MFPSAPRAGVIKSEVGWTTEWPLQDNAGRLQRLAGHTGEAQGGIISLSATPKDPWSTRPCRL